MNPSNQEAARQLQRDVERQLWAQRRLKKDAVLHLRVESDIMDRIKAEASARDMSVSDLVRCYLIERFSGTGVAEGLPDFLREVLAFSDVAVVNDSPCAACGQVLPRGTNARLAHGPLPPARLVCGNCYDGLQSYSEEEQVPSAGEK
ncbi:MAG: hypothetical protein QG656_1094 [Candidatus Hydrogenedentes bacterium]|nr:hypothetical protein [Candidatus Hydrogenedentota bacterium]